MQMYDRNDPTDNWKTAKRADPTGQDISLQGRERREEETRKLMEQMEKESGKTMLS